MESITINSINRPDSTVSFGSIDSIDQPDSFDSIDSTEWSKFGEELDNSTKESSARSDDSSTNLEKGLEFRCLELGETLTARGFPNEIIDSKIDKFRDIIRTIDSEQRESEKLGQPVMRLELQDEDGECGGDRYVDIRSLQPEVLNHEIELRAAALELYDLLGDPANVWFPDESETEEEEQYEPVEEEIVFSW